MLYIITLAFIFVWMVAILFKRKLSMHTIVASYSIAVFLADMLEININLLLDLYKFPTHLRSNPIYDNELGIIFADTLILPFTFIVFVYYASQNKHPWRTTLLFATFIIFLEWIYVNLGYLTYKKWSIIYSAILYIAGFRFVAYLAPRITSYNPPIPYRFVLLCFSHMIIMWIGALFASPLFELYQFKPGFFVNFMADCRFTELLSGDILALLIIIFIPRLSPKYKPLAFAVIAGIGIAFALYSYHKGWLIYHQWNHLLTSLRYIVPIFLIMLYDRWETSHRTDVSILANAQRK